MKIFAKKMNYSDCLNEQDPEFINLIFNDKMTVYQGVADAGFALQIGTMKSEFKKATTKGRFAHVLWSKPMVLGRWDIPHQLEYTRIHALLSLALLKEHGQEVVLYTDHIGMRVLGDLPYDAIHNVLDTNPMNEAFWASGKIIALANEPLDSCIVDTDLFVFDGSIIDKINNNNRSVCSHIEDTSKYKYILKDFCYETGLQFNQSSTNTGFMKIADQELRDQYIRSYFQLAYTVQNNPKLANFFSELTNYEKLFAVIVEPLCNQNVSNEYIDLLKQTTLEKYKTKNGIYCADLLCEQYVFSLLKPEAVLIDEENGHIGAGDMRDFGMCHLLSAGKFVRIQEVMDRLKDFPEFDKLLEIEYVE